MPEGAFCCGSIINIAIIVLFGFYIFANQPQIECRVPDCDEVDTVSAHVGYEWRGGKRREVYADVKPDFEIYKEYQKYFKDTLIVLFAA